MSIVCTAVSYRVASLEPGDRLSGRLADHLASCLSCQATVARDRRLRRAMASLGTEVIPAPAGFAIAVDRAILAPGRVEAVAGSPVARAVVGTVAAVAAGTVAVAAWRLGRKAA